jgi:hypothetical protein
VRWIAAYAALGVVCAVVLRLWKPSSRRTGPPPAPDWRSFRAPGPRSPYEWLADRVIVPVIAVTILPLVLFATVVEQLLRLAGLKAAERRSSEPKAFEVNETDLREPLTRDEVERREVVGDPLHAVPERPFGHLHPAWQRFLDGLEPGDAIWSFRAERTTAWNHRELRAGYVAVRGDTPAHHMLTMRRSLDQ